MSLALGVFATGSLLAADGGPKEAVIRAAGALAGQPNYSWRTTLENVTGGFRRGPTEGKTEKGGYTTLSMSLNDGTIDVVIKGTNSALRTAEKGWQSAAEAIREGGNGITPAVFIARMLPSYQMPAVQALALAGDTKTLTVGTNGIVGELTEEGAKAELFSRTVTTVLNVRNAKGTVTFWLADGKLVKYRVQVSGTVGIGGNDHDIDRTTLTEIKNVGTTRLEVADDAKKKLE